MKKSFLAILLIALASVCFARTEKLAHNSEMFKSIEESYNDLGFKVHDIYTCDTADDMVEIAGNPDDWVLLADEEIDFDLNLGVVAICSFEGKKVAIIMIYEDYEMMVLMADIF